MDPLRTLNELLQRCTGGAGLDHVIDSMLSSAIAAFDADAVLLRFRSNGAWNTTGTTHDGVRLAIGGGSTWDTAEGRHRRFDVTSSTWRRWSEFASTADEHGWTVCTALQLRHAEMPVGQLFVADRATSRPTPADAIDAYAMAAGVLLGQAISADEAESRAEHLQRALVERLVIEQAKGFVAAQRTISPDDAFQLLRGAARSSNSNLHELCRRVLDGRTSVGQLARTGVVRR